MNRSPLFLFSLTVAVALAVAAAMFCGPQDPAPSGKTSGSKGVELPHPFYWAVPDPLRGDWQGQAGYVAQVTRTGDKLLSVPDLLPERAEYGTYQANVFKAFDVPNDRPVAVLKGVKTDNGVAFTGDGWSGTIEAGRFRASNGSQS